jgi:hypothetical protein
MRNKGEVSRMAVVSYEYNGTLAIEVFLFFIFAVVFSRQYPCHRRCTPNKFFNLIMCQYQWHTDAFCTISNSALNKKENPRNLIRNEKAHLIICLYLAETEIR